MTIDEMLDACDKINGARNLLNQTKIVPQQPDDLKVYLATISWVGQPTKIKMTILGLTQMTAGDKVREILADDGYDTDDVNFRLFLKEIEGPFKAGFVISRNRA